MSEAYVCLKISAFCSLWGQMRPGSISVASVTTLSKLTASVGPVALLEAERFCLFQKGLFPKGLFQNVSSRVPQIQTKDGTLAVNLPGDHKQLAWRVMHGPFEIRVLGARFESQWHSEAQHLEVKANAGDIAVQGPMLGRQGMALQAGQILRVNLAEGRVELAQQAPRAATGLTDASRAGGEAKPVLARGRFRKGADLGFKTHGAKRIETSTAKAPDQIDSAETLLHRMRSARARRAAAEALGAVHLFVKTYPNHPQTAYATLTEGIVLMDLMGNRKQALEVFSRVIKKWSNGGASGAIVEAAAGRRLALMAGQTGEDFLGASDARRAAKEYLDDFPEGAYAPLAQHVLRAPSPNVPTPAAQDPDGL